MRTTALLLRFLLELALIATAAYLGWTLADGGWPGTLLALLAPAAVITLWATYLSPKAHITISPPARVALETLLFGGAGYLLWQAGAPTTGTALAAVWVLDRVVLALTAGAPSALEPGRPAGP
ncbi:YrdB family protein [Promicromonospora sp. NPDC023987]|uniref:YrdB family protein n=1 Tax=Promicromonospora sp. NPDC023987 TaxID=3155360 RepID=UPI0033D099EB